MCAISFQAEVGHVDLLCVYVYVVYAFPLRTYIKSLLHLLFALQSHPWPPPLTDLLCHSLLISLCSHMVSSVLL